MGLPVYKMILGEGDEYGVDAIAFVANPAIQVGWMAFDDQESQRIKFQTIDEEERIVLGALLIPDQKIYRREGEREFYVTADKDTIKQVRERFMKNKYTSNLNAEHTELMLKDVYMIETFISDEKKGIKAPEQFKSLPEGTWFGAFKVDNDSVWNDYVKTGQFTGFSIEGNVQLQKINLTENIMSKTIKETLQEMFKQYFGEESPLPAPVELAKATLKDGTEILVNPALEMGASVLVVTDEGDVTAPDATHELSDGTKVTTVGGVITEIETVKEEETEMNTELPALLAEMTAQFKALTEELKAEISAVKTENETLKAEFAKIGEDNESVKTSIVQFMEELKNLPAEKPTQTPESTTVKMSATEKSKARAIAIAEALKANK